jgi:hypothetical protein
VWFFVNFARKVSLRSLTKVDQNERIIISFAY